MTVGAGRRGFWTAAGRFEDLDNALRRREVRVLSLDVFDTLLWRRVPKPTDAHLLLGRRLADEGILKPHVGPRVFARLRVLAEEEARARHQEAAGSPEVRLSEICALLAPAVSNEVSAADLAEREFENERSITFVDERLVSFLIKGLSADLAVIAVSDSYFTAEQIKRLLGDHGADRVQFEKIYTSSDVGTGKGGNLWRHVIDDLAVPPSSIIHVGDNYDADVAAAGGAGITGVHLPPSTERFTEILAREGIAGDTGEPSQWCNERDGDGGMTAIRRRAALLPPASVDPPLQERVTWEVGTAVLGPVFAGFSQWVHERAAALGASRALCVMREGRFIKRLLDAAQPIPEHSLATSTVWASREACARASIYDGSEAELRSFLARLRIPSPRQVLDSLGLSPAEWPDLRQFVETLQERRIGDESAGNRLIDHILERPELVKAVVLRSRARRQRLVQHLRSAAGPGKGPVLLVDVGWGATILESLQRMIDEEGGELDLHGLYVLAHVGSSGPLLRGMALEGYLGDAGFIPFDVAGVTGNPELVELACMCEDGTFLEMDQRGQPVLLDGVLPAMQAERRQVLQDGIVAFLAEWVEQRSAAQQYESSPSGRAMLRRVLERFLSQPTTEEVDAFRWWGHEENFGSSVTDQLVPDHLLPTLHLRTAENLHHAPPSELYWVGAAASLVDQETADAVFLMRRGRVGPGRFAADLGIGTAAIWLGNDRDRQRLVAEVPVVANRRGLTLIEWKGDAGDATSVVIRPANAAAVLRLDALDVTSLRELPAPTGHGPTVLSTDAFRIENAVTLGRHAIAIDSHSRLIVPIPASVRRASPVTVVLGGSYLPMPSGLAGVSPSLSALAAEAASLRRELSSVYNTKIFRSTAGARRLYARLRKPRRSIGNR